MHTYVHPHARTHTHTHTHTHRCAMFWRRSKLERIASTPLHLDISAVFDRPNVCQILEFRTVEGARGTPAMRKPSEFVGGSAQFVAGEALSAGSRALVVANTHILFNPKRGDIKLQQVQMTLSKLWEVRARERARERERARASERESERERERERARERESESERER